MPAFSPMGKYNLTSTQVDLILYALSNVELTPLEDDERRKIIDSFYHCGYTTTPSGLEEPYTNLCDI